MNTTTTATMAAFAPSRVIDLNVFETADQLREPILVVDHLPLPRRSLVDELSKSFECTEATSAFEALQLLKNQSFSVVITATMLPGLSGVELLRTVVRDYQDTAVIVISEIDRSQRALDAVRLGAFDYLIKPFEPVQMQMTIERAIEYRQLRIDARRYKHDLEARNAELEQGKRELQRLQAQIVHSEKMASLGQLAAGVAHELNNPVGFVYGNLDLLRERVNGLFRLLQSYDHMIGDQPQSEHVQALKAEIDYGRAQDDMDSILDDCMEGATRIRDIVQNLRTFSRLDEAELKKSDINEGINSTLRILSKYFSKDNIKLTCELGQLPEIEAYAGQLNQVWMNLLVNAAQAVSVSGGEVTLRTAADGDRIVVSISDTGSGIAPEHLGKIFDPFFTTKPVGEGSGLGLSISFGIIERHGGRIEVESILNEGSKFTVTLPVSAPVRSEAG